MVCYIVYYLLINVMNNTKNTEFIFVNMLEMWVIFSSECLVLLLSYLLDPQPFTALPPTPLPVCGRWKHFMRFVVSIRLQFDSSRQTFWDWVRAATMPGEWGLCLAFEALSGLFSVLLSFCACCCSALLCIISSSDCAPESEADRKLLPPLP